MSFYFHLDSPRSLDPTDILAEIPQDNVQFLQIDASAATFFKPNSSLRGVSLSFSDAGIEVGLNAFTTRYDATLAHQIAHAAATILCCGVRPEDSEDLVAADRLHTYCGENWISARMAEAGMLLNIARSQSPDEPIIVSGYRRDFAVTNALVDALRDGGRTDDQVISELFKQGMELQELDQVEDIFAANLLSTNKSANLKGLVRRIFSKQPPDGLCAV